MIGIVVQLIISWLLLRLIERKNLFVLGLLPTKQRIKDFATGLFLPILYFTLLFFVMAFFNKTPYTVNSNYTITGFVSALWFIFKSVAFENLIFTGALLYILIRRIGPTKAIIVSGIAVGIYHWFSWSLFGQPVQMIVVFLTTGVAGCLWALAFYRTKSSYFPFALHFGIDFAFMIMFSKDKNMGSQFLTQPSQNAPYDPGIFISVVLAILYFAGFPLLTYFYLMRMKLVNEFQS